MSNHLQTSQSRNSSLSLSSCSPLSLQGGKSWGPAYHHRQHQGREISRNLHLVFHNQKCSVNRTAWLDEYQWVCNRQNVTHGHTWSCLFWNQTTSPSRSELSTLTTSSFLVSFTSSTAGPFNWWFQGLNLGTPECQIEGLPMSYYTLSSNVMQRGDIVFVILTI